MEIVTAILSNTGVQTGLGSLGVSELIAKPIAGTQQEQTQIAAEDEYDFQQKQMAEMLKGLGTQDKVIGQDAYMSDPVLASLLGGGDIQTLQDILLGMDKNKPSSGGLA